MVFAWQLRQPNCHKLLPVRGPKGSKPSAIRPFSWSNWCKERATSRLKLLPITMGRCGPLACATAPSATPPENPRRSAFASAFSGAGSGPAQGVVGWCPPNGLSQCRSGRIPLPTGNRPILVHGDEGPVAGRTSGHPNPRPDSTL